MTAVPRELTRKQPANLPAPHPAPTARTAGSQREGRGNPAWAAVRFLSAFIGLFLFLGFTLSLISQTA